MEDEEKEKEMKGFTVIDKTTGQYPDCEKIALEEDWAKNLLYCDIYGFAITEDGNLLLMDDCGKVAYCPNDRFEVVEEVEPSPLYEKDNWHTGIPTEEGLYVIAYRFGYKIEHEVREMFYSPMYGMTFGIKKDIVAWQKIEPYRG